MLCLSLLTDSRLSSSRLLVWHQLQSSLEQLQQNMAASTGGELPVEVVEAVDAAYNMVKAREYHYARGTGVWRDALAQGRVGVKMSKL